MKIKNTNENTSLLLVIMFFSFQFSWHLTVSNFEELLAHLPQDRILFECSSLTPPFTDFQKPSFNNELSPPSAVAPIHTFLRDPSSQLDYPCPCIFNTSYTRTFMVSAGHNFVRLHFSPALCQDLNVSNALFSVSANGYTLLITTKSCFSKYPPNSEYFAKEFSINVDGQILNVTFSPSMNSSSSFAILSKIEIVSMKPNLYIQENVSIPIIGYPNTAIYLNSSTALETIYRVNVGGETISARYDTGMFRVWSKDDAYFNKKTTNTTLLKSEVGIRYSEMPWYTAPKEIYTTARTMFSSSVGNMSWIFEIDSGFLYLIRLHFCEISQEITQENQRVFHVYINNQTAEYNADVIRWSNGSGVPVYRDYIVNFTRDYRDMHPLWITVQRETETGKPFGPILNGLEIFKLSDANKSLAGSNPFGGVKQPDPIEGKRPFLPDPGTGKPPKIHFRWKRIISLSLFIAVLALSFVIAFFIYFPSWLVFCSDNEGRRKPFLQWEPTDQCRYFSFAEIKSATNNFSEALLIGYGGFGKVYKGYIDNKAIEVAIKRGSPNSNQGSQEFHTEITMLSKLRHCHLVSLIGYCMDNGEMILVYEFMVRGNLHDHLCKTENPPLPWEKRLKICIGAARGLHYLHTGMDHTIIHRDVKTRNILLNEEWVAKVSDFGLSRLGPNLMNQSQTHVSTMVKGSFGYLDPDYYRRQRLTEKSDVYSFGVVLLEVLCARPAVISMVEEEGEDYEQVNLAEWALHSDQNGTLDQIIDPYLMGKIDPECFKTFTETAKKCLANKGSERPTMGDVLWNLEYAWRQQIGESEGENKIVGLISKSNSCCEFPVSVMTESLTNCHSDAKLGTKVSKIMSPVGHLETYPLKSM